jgi:hypothetical protein
VGIREGIIMVVVGEATVVDEVEGGVVGEVGRWRE